MSLTLAIIKPDAVEAGNTGKILMRLEDAGFMIRAIRMTRLKSEQAGSFYAIHSERTFFESLVTYMTSGPVVALVLETEDAVTKLREVIGATDPSEAEEGTIRRVFADSKERNAIHGSDSTENAEVETAFFFPKHDRLAL